MRIHHLAFRTHDLPRLERFYVSVLGLAVKRRDERRSVWLAIGDAVLMLEQAGENEASPPAGSMELVALAVTAVDRDHAVKDLHAQGVSIEARTAHTIYFRDPDGRRVGLSDHPLA